jgi:hypothetical protein
MSELQRATPDMIKELKKHRAKQLGCKPEDLAAKVGKRGEIYIDTWENVRKRCQAKAVKKH